MNPSLKSSTTEKSPNTLAGIASRAGQIIGVFVFLAVILFLAAGTLNWTWAWVFLGLYVLSVAINSAFLLRTNPETIAERGRPKEMKDWDKLISGLWGLAQFIAVPLVAGLDFRFGWTGDIGLTWHLAGVVIFSIGLAIFGWAMIANAYFSTAVRIQTDRGQTVCRSGPYRFVRHPGYTGANLQSLGAPLLLGSFWALVPGLIAVILMTIRTSLEDRTLQNELPGYPEYVREVRYRLVPGIW
jgi:protein-S-isoprenylcysteine O-methyltransferase Ste14